MIKGLSYFAAAVLLFAALVAVIEKDATSFFGTLLAVAWVSVITVLVMKAFWEMDK